MIKTLIVTLLMLICITSCTPSINNGQYEYDDAVEVDGKHNGHCKVVEITVNGETHQYLKYATGSYKFGLAHWEGCKYCKAQNTEYYDGTTDNPGRMATN